MSECERLFFVHVMKTGGTTFLYNLLAKFGPGEVFPDPVLDPDRVAAYTEMSYLLGLPPERTAVIRAYSGHFPFVAVDLLPGDFVTLTVLRDPIDRTISYLKQCRDLPQYAEMPLEQIYEDPWQYAMVIWNFQTRVFAMTRDDPALGVAHALEIDDRRLAIAKANLQRIDVLGLHERYDEFAARVTERFGWSSMPSPNRRVGKAADVPDALRRRIAEDNAYDLEFYEYARALYATRAERR